MEFNSLVYPAPPPKGSIDIFMGSAQMKKLMHLVDQRKEGGAAGKTAAAVDYQIPCVFYDRRGRSFFNS